MRYFANMPHGDAFPLWDKVEKKDLASYVNWHNKDLPAGAKKLEGSIAVLRSKLVKLGRKVLEKKAPTELRLPLVRRVFRKFKVEWLSAFAKAANISLAVEMVAAKKKVVLCKKRPEIKDKLEDAFNARDEAEGFAWDDSVKTHPCPKDCQYCAAGTTKVAAK